MKDSYIPYLDGLRGFAIIIVIIAHMGLDYIIPGGFGVNLFFFISGYLITGLLIKENDSWGKIDLKNFYLRRIFRLYPALLFSVSLSVIIIIILHGKINIMAILSALFYFTNYYIVYIKPPILKECDHIFDVIWSLSVEEHFYIFFPFIFGIFYRYKTTFTISLVLVSFLILLYRCYLLHISKDMDDTIFSIYFTTHTRADSIIWGCVSAIVLYGIKSQFYLKQLKSVWSIVIGVVLILFSLLFRNVMFRESIRFTVQALAFFLIVPAIQYLPATNFIKRVLENKTITFIGKLSYSLYLFHWMCIVFADSYFKEHSPIWIVFVLVSSTSLALISYRFIERPFISIRKKLGSNTR